MTASAFQVGLGLIFVVGFSLKLLHDANEKIANIQFYWDYASLLYFSRIFQSPTQVAATHLSAA